MRRRTGRRFCCWVLLSLVSNLAVFYFLHYRLLPSPAADPIPFPQDHLTGKPWPALPSFLPWRLHPHSGSCEGYFGNGFTRRLDLVPKKPGGGWFRCFYSETLQSSICEGGRLRLDPGKVNMSTGGERLEEVIGRSEQDELPRFELGALQLQVGSEGGARQVAGVEFLDQYLPRGTITRHAMKELVASMVAVGDGDEFQCLQWIEGSVVLVTRFEYANLFHTVTDWYSAYAASRVTGLPARPHLIFVDGHCESPMEQTWNALFSSVRYLKNFTGPICFQHAVFSPLGYETALFKGLTETIDCYGASAHELLRKQDEGKTARISEFGEMLRAAFGLPIDEHHVDNPSLGLNVLFVRRENYLAHPRHGGKLESRLSNEQEVFDVLRDWVISHTNCQINLVNGLFGHMPMKEQYRLIQDASVIIGAHGAGLTHIVAASPKAVILEIISSLFRRPHFALISQWRGLEYHAINLLGSVANPEQVIKKLSDILTKFGC